MLDIWSIRFSVLESHNNKCYLPISRKCHSLPKWQWKKAKHFESSHQPFFHYIACNSNSKLIMRVVRISGGFISCRRQFATKGVCKMLTQHSIKCVTGSMSSSYSELAGVQFSDFCTMCESDVNWYFMFHSNRSFQ